MQQQDARRLDRHDRQRQRAPALARHRRLRRGQGGPGQPGRSLAVEWAPKVRVNTLVVGLVQTELSPTCTTATTTAWPPSARTVPLGRLADPADVGDAAVFLASTAPPTSPAPPCSSTAAANAPPSSTRANQTSTPAGGAD